MTLNEEMINLQKAVDNLKYEIYKIYKITKIKTKRKMKKLLLTLVTLLSLNIYSQPGTYAVPQLTSIDGVCTNPTNTVFPVYHRGDIVRLGIKYTYFVGTEDPFNPNGLGRVKFLEGSNSLIIIEATDGDGVFQALPNYTVTCNDSGVFKYIDYTIPMTTQYGLCSFAASGGSYYLGLMFSSTIKIYVEDNNPVGIEELTKENIKSVSYFDLNGIEVTTLEDNILYVKKTTYNNGAVKSEKIIQH